MNKIAHTAVVLVVITTVAAVCLGAVSEITKAPIAAQVKKTQDEAMQAVLPEAESFKAVETELTGTISSINGGYIGEELCGYVINVKPNGFGGAVDTMVGVDTEGTVTGLKVLSHSETPGLGARASEAEFQEQFVGKTAPISVTKDGGEIQAITSATITSRAVSAGATEACEWFAQNGGAK